MPDLAGDREQVEHAVRRAAGAGDRGDRVLERVARQDLRRPDVVADELHHELARLARRLGLRRVRRRDAGEAARADAEEVDHDRHRVGGELAAARAGAGAGDRLERVHLLVGHRPGGARADRLEDVLDRHVAALVAAGRDRAVVEDEAGDVEPRERHRAGGDRLVAADEADEAVEQVARDDELDRVGDHLARDQRGAHAGRAHRDAVGDRDRVELDRRAAGGADAVLHVLREHALVEVARHRLDPGRRDADERLREILVGEADRLQHRAGRGAVDAVGQRGAVALGGIGGLV